MIGGSQYTVKRHKRLTVVVSWNMSCEVISEKPPILTQIAGAGHLLTRTERVFANIDPLKLARAGA
jgi:hypothetical protein